MVQWKVRARQLEALGRSIVQGTALRVAAEDAYRREYRALLARAIAGPARHGDTLCRARLRALRGSRLPVSSDPAGVRVAGFGTNDDWRRNGIWTAFQRATEFRLFEVPDGRYGECRSEEEEQRAKESDFLSFVDAWGEVRVCVFSHSGRHISDGLLRQLERRGVWSIIMSADDQHQFIGPLDRTGEAHQLRVARQADLYWTGWRLGARLVDSIGGNAWFAPHAADPERYRPISCEKSLDVVFVGGCNRVRLDIVSGLSRYFNVSAFGRGWPAGSVSFDETIQLFSRSRVVLGIGGIGHSFAIQMIKGRDFEVAMCGATYVTSAYSEVAECFDVGREIACYLSLEDCVEVVAKLLDDSELRTSMGHAARARSVRDHTWDRRVRSLFDLFGAASDRGMADDASTAPVRRS